MKAVVNENYELDFSETVENINRFLTNSNSWKSIARIKIHILRFQISSATNFVGEWELDRRNLVSGCWECELEYREKSMLSEFFQVFGLPRFWCKDRKRRFLFRTFHKKCQTFDWNLDGRSQDCSYEETWALISRKIVFIRMFPGFRTFKSLKQGSRNLFQLNLAPHFDNFWLRFCWRKPNH